MHEYDMSDLSTMYLSFTRNGGFIYLSCQRRQKTQFGPRGNSTFPNKVFSFRLLTSCTFKTFLRSIKVLGKLFNKSTNLSKIISSSFPITDRTEE